jgi:hypothetical protein
MPNYFSDSLISNDHTTDSIYSAVDWSEWRDCFSGGRTFRDVYLEPFSDRETTKEYERRRDITPIPSYARKEIVGIKNQIGHRLPDVTRKGGSQAWRDAVNGRGRGVDLRGSSMNSYIVKPFGVLEDLLVIGKVGVLLDVPRVNGPTAADIPENFRPYLSLYPVERIKRLEPAAPDSISDWLVVAVEDEIPTFNFETNESEITKRVRWFILDSERDNRLTIRITDDTGKELESPILTESQSIPFVFPNIGMSLMADACSYQIAMLNMISADSSYAVDSNFAVMVRQRGQAGGGDYLMGADNEAETGARKGLFYDKGLDAPSFIAPPSDPLKWSLQLRREMKEEIHELVTGALSSVDDQGSIESGLAFIGSTLNWMEDRLWGHWAEVMNTNPSRREVPIVNYPVDWDVKSDKERIEEAEALLDLMNKLPGRQGKKEAAKQAYDKLYRGKVKDTDLSKMKKEVDDAPYATADPDILDMAGERGYVGMKTASLALGFEEDESDIAKEEKAERAKQIVAAQADAKDGAAAGAPEASVDPDSNKLAREGEADTTAKLGGDDEPGVRGEGT